MDLRSKNLKMGQNPCQVISPPCSKCSRDSPSLTQVKTKFLHKRRLCNSHALLSSPIASLSVTLLGATLPTVGLHTLQAHSCLKETALALPCPGQQQPLTPAAMSFRSLLTCHLLCESFSTPVLLVPPVCILFKIWGYERNSVRFIYLFWPGWGLVFSVLSLLSSGSDWASHWGGFYCCTARALGLVSFGSCDSWAY